MGGVVWFAVGSDTATAPDSSPTGSASASAGSAEAAYDVVPDLCTIDVTALSDWTAQLPTGESDFDDTSDVRGDCIFAMPSAAIGFYWVIFDATVFGDAKSAENVYDSDYSSYYSLYTNSSTCSNSLVECVVEDDVSEVGDRSFGAPLTFQTSTDEGTLQTFRYEVDINADNLILTTFVDYYCAAGVVCVDANVLKQHAIDLASSAYSSIPRA